MKQAKLFFLIFFLFLIQGTVMPLIPLNFGWSHIQPVSEFAMVALFMVAFFGPSGWWLRYALIFGILADVVYASVLGVYAFCFTLTAYLIYELSRWMNMNSILTVLLIALGICMMETEVYLIYAAIGITDQRISLFLQNQLLPTVVLNVVFTLLIYFPMRRFLEGMTEEIEK